MDPTWATKTLNNVADPAHNSEPVSAFKSFRLADNKFTYSLDGRIKLVDQYAVDESGNQLKAYPGDTLSFDADSASEICELNAPCAGPGGQTHVNKPADYNQQEWAAYNLAEYPVRDAYLGELCAMVGNAKIRVGLHNTYTVPQGAGEVDIRIGANICDRFAHLAKGGHKVRMEIRKAGKDN